MRSAVGELVRLISGEWILGNRSNGAVVIVLRALWASTFIYSIAIAFAEISAPGSQACFDVSQLRLRISTTIPWFGAIFGGVYFALYARFASQWLYLAQLYNQQMQVAATTPPNCLQKEKWVGWKAAFIEDAHSLHLACKPTFAAAINQMLKEASVIAEFRSSTLGADEKLANMHERFRKLGLSPFPL